MSTLRTCPHGHPLPDPAANDTTLALGEVVCPVCRKAAEEATLPQTAPPGQQTERLPAELPSSGADATLTHVGPTTARPVLKQTVAAKVEIPGYEVLGELGRGGMGVVYKARHIKLNRLVALKMVLSGVHAGAAELARFRTEAEAVAALQHPNIVQIYEVGEQDGRPYFSLEFVDGGSLEDRLDGSPQPPRQAAEMIEHLARAVHYAHQRGILHRDLKPANVLLTTERQPKITDFGLAKRLDGTGQTQTGEVMGTPSYMSPEQAAGRTRDIGPATDIYALGTMLYDMLTGRPPFQAASVLETLEQVRTQEPLPPSRLQLKLPRDLETVCLKCLHKEPARRYATAGDLADDLRRFLNHEPIHARRVGPVERGWRWCRRNPVVAGLLAVLFVAFISGFAFALLVWHESANQYQAMALQGTALQARTYEVLRESYTRDVVARAQAQDVLVTHDFRDHKGAIPLPATFVKELGTEINRDRPGAAVRLYSDYPFPWRQGSGPQDQFERDALKELRRDPEKPFYRFEEVDDRPTLRYAVADRMKPACVKCHNTHSDSPKRDWKVGDVRGVLEIIRPLDDEVARSRARQRKLFAIPVVAAVLAVAGLLFIGGRRLFSRSA